MLAFLHFIIIALLLSIAEAAECGSQAGGQLCPNADECCSTYGFCDVGDAWCGQGCQNGPCYPTPPPTALPTVSMIQPPDTATAEHGDSRLIAYVGNWQDCPTVAQTDAYTHIIVAFAVSYTYRSWKNECDEQCNILTEGQDGLLTVCGNAVNQELVNSWREAGKKVLLSFGGAGMGGSWSGDSNNCWDYCFGREEKLSTALVDIVRRQNFDGIDIDYEYCYDAEGSNNWSKTCPQKTELYSDEKAQYFLSTMTTLLRQKLDALQASNGYNRGRYELTHAPMDPDAVPESAYYQILKKHSSMLDFVMPQFYNGYTQPAADGFDGQVGGRTKTSEVYNNLVNDMFDGQPEKVVFGFCIQQCNPSINGADAVEVLQQVKTYNDGEFACNGGAFFWVAFTDGGGTWSDAVWEEVRQTAGCSFSLDDFEIIPIKFKVKGIRGGETEAIKAELTIVFDRVLLRLEDMIPGMKVLSIDEDESANMYPIIVGDEATMYYNAYIEKDNFREFKPIIIQELRNSYHDVLYTIPFSDVAYINGGLEFDWCAKTHSGYTLCVQEDLPSSKIGPSKPPSSTEMTQPATSLSIQSNSNANDDDGDATLPGWAIFLIVMSILLLVCVGYWSFDRHKSKERRNTVFYDDDSQSTDDRSWKSRASNAISDHISWVKSSESASVRSKASQSSSIASASYGSRRNREALRQHYDTSIVNHSRQGRDPTMYIPSLSLEGRPDPDSRSVSSSRKYYPDDIPSLKPKRDPTEYIQ